MSYLTTHVEAPFGRRREIKKNNNNCRVVKPKNKNRKTIITRHRRVYLCTIYEYRLQSKPFNRRNNLLFGFDLCDFERF